MTGLVESMTVYDKDRIVWKLTCGVEMRTKKRYDFITWFLHRT